MSSSALRTYLRVIDGIKGDHDVVMVGPDAEGIGVRVADCLGRISLSRPIGSPAEGVRSCRRGREVLVEMVVARPAGG